MNEKPLFSRSREFRLGRIQKVSAWLKTLSLLAAIASAIIGTTGILLANFDKTPLLQLSIYAFFLGRAAVCWSAYKLFSYYANGDYFAAKSIWWLRGIGVTSLGMGALNLSNNL